MKTVLIFISAFICTISYSQNRNNIWCFGDSTGIDFNSTLPIPIHSAIKSRGTCASIADSTGQLLFYAGEDADVYTIMGPPHSNGEIWTKQHQTMQNGDSIIMALWYMEALIIDNLANQNHYYVFTIGVTGNYGLYYSEVDMTKNGGLGEVIQKNVQLLSDHANDGLTAVKHGNGRDWWVIHRKHQGSNNTFYKFLVSPSGISVPYTQNIGSNTQTNTCRYIFNKTGDKLAMILYDGLIETFDFDRCTGLLSNHIVIRPKNTSPPTPSLWSCAFSPNNRFLYVSSSDIPSSSLIQIDLQDSTPWTNADTIWSDSTCAFEGGALRLAPDDKIYLTCAWNNGSNNYPYPDTLHNNIIDNLSVINSPDSPGTSCNFTPFSFYLGGNRTYWGLPNNPDYDLGPLVGSPCDSLSVGINELPIKSNGDLFVFYHNGWQMAFINAKALKGKGYKLNVYDMMGKLVYKEEGNASTSLSMTHEGYFTRDLNCAAFANGVYIVSIQTEKERLVKKFVKQ